MSSSWFLVLIPTKEHEARLQNLNIVESIEDVEKNVNDFSNETSKTGGESRSSTLFENAKNDANANADPVVKHENTEHTDESFTESHYYKNHHPPIQLAQKDLNKPNEDLTLECTYFELDLQEALQILNVNQATYQLTKNGNFYLVSFCIEVSNVEAALICLQSYGIGNTEFTSISVVPSSIHIDCPDCPFSDEDLVESSIHNLKKAESSESINNNSIPNGKRIHSPKTSKINIDGLEKRIDLFYTSIKSRMLVAEVVNGIKAGSEFTFDYLLLVVLASIIAFFGLLENSSVVLVASMLVSPIMGPILAGIFGCIIGDNQLRNRGIQHELISLGICILIGFIFGLFFCAMGPETYYDQSPNSKWPTPEMTSRGNVRSLVTGIAIALPSGAGVALSVLGGNVGSLVGVAISASLLPPAVNAGLFWAAACYYGSNSNFDNLPGWTEARYNISLVENSTIVNNITLVHTDFDNYEWSETVVDRDATNKMEYFAIDAAFKGFISLALTIVNIICIILMGVIILRIKEVTPEKIPQRFSSFWQEHVKTHRNYLREQYRGSMRTKSKQDRENTLTLLEEVRDVLNVVGDSETEDGLEDTFLHNLFEKARHDVDYADILRATGKPAPIQQPMPLQRLMSRRVTVANDKENRSMSILDIMRGSNRFKVKDDFGTGPAKHFVRTDSHNEDTEANATHETLYKQAKMIQRSRSIGTGLSRRRRHKLSKKIKQVQIKSPLATNGLNEEEDDKVTEQINEMGIEGKQEKKTEMEPSPAKDEEEESKKASISETSL